MRRVRLLPFVALGWVLIFPPLPSVASGDAVLIDCGDDEKLSRTYTQSDYRDALGLLDGDAAQYTSCEAVIRRAQLAAAGSKSGRPGAGSGVNGSTSNGTTAGSSTSSAAVLAQATPAQREEVAKVAATPPAPVALPGAGTVDPTNTVVPELDAIGSLPAPLGVVLALAFAAGARWGIKRRRPR